MTSSEPHRGLGSGHPRQEGDPSAAPAALRGRQACAVAAIVCGALSAAPLREVSAQEETRSLPGIVATVGNEPITRTELDHRIQRELSSRGGQVSLEELRKYKPELERAILDLEINDLLLLQEAGRVVSGAPEDESEEERRRPRRKGSPARGTWAGIRATYIRDSAVDEEIESRIARLREKGISISSTQHFYDLEKQRTGLDRQGLRDEIRKELAIQRFLREEVFRKVDSFVAPSESRYYYRTHLEEFASPVEVSYRQIFLEPDRFTAPLAMEKIDEGLEKGVAFEELARRYSQDFEDPEDRGQIVSKSFDEIQHWEAPLPDVLKSLPEGRPSHAIVSRRAIHYFLIVDRVEGKPKSYEEAQDDIERTIRLARRQQRYERLIEKLRERTLIRVLLPGADELAGPVEAGDDTGAGEEDEPDAEPRPAK